MRRENIRNFVIIAHIDHGKSTLADRFLELTGTVEKRKMREQMLDAMDLERERGITIKMTPVRMHYTARGVKYILNLIDTPGHVDFSYEVSRALAAVEGAILLVDASKGVQAQTLAHLREAERQNLVIIPVINKIDLPVARADEVEKEIRALLPGAQTVFRISAKTGEGVAAILDEVVRTFPPPRAGETPHPRALVFDSVYDSHVGAIAYVRVFDHEFKKNPRVLFCASGVQVSAVEIGTFSPERTLAESLETGAVGYIATGIKEPSAVRVGDTVAGVSDSTSSPVIRSQALPGYREPQPVVFASIFPSEGAEFALLEDAIGRLKLSDSSLTYEPESSSALGKGFRCGFLGSLHVEIVLERLQREHNVSFIATVPSVQYVIEKDGVRHEIVSATDFPTVPAVILEPWVRATLFTPAEHLGAVLSLLHSRRGVKVETRFVGALHVEVQYELPLSEVIVDFYDKLKSVSSGFASFFYEDVGLRPGDLTKLSIRIAGEENEALARIVPTSRAYEEGSRMVRRLKETLPRQWFDVPLQAVADGRIIARETLKALRKDVTGYLYGGDVTRKKKLLEKQKRGKKKMASHGQGTVRIPPEVYVKLLREQ